MFPIPKGLPNSFNARLITRLSLAILLIFPIIDVGAAAGADGPPDVSVPLIFLN